MSDLSTAIAKVLSAHREQSPLVTGGLAPCVTCGTPYPCAVAEALEPARAILAGGHNDDRGVEMAVIVANTRRDNAEAQVVRLGHLVEDAESETRDAYRKLEDAETQIEQLERQLSDGGARFHTARENYLPSHRGTGCKSCAVWSPERLNLDEFTRLPHQFGCPLSPESGPLAPDVQVRP